MAALNPEFPANTPLSLQPKSVPGRPGGVGGPGPSNRPIPLQPKSELPEAYDEEEEDDDLREALKNAPAWLVSTVFHMLLLIILGLLAVTAQMKSTVLEVEVAYAEQLGTQLENPNVLEGDSALVDPLAKEQIITPKDLAPVDDPLAAPLQLSDIRSPIGLGPSPITGPIKIDGAPIGLALKGRQIGSKNVLLGKYGGTAVTESAVELGLVWLSKQQKPDGSWSLLGPFADGTQSENTAAATAMALLAFQGHGDTHREGKYANVVAHGWSWLLKQQRKDGGFTGATMVERTQLLYTHAQCTIAICELYGMTGDSTYRPAAERAVAYCVAAQDKQRGGWRYEFAKLNDSDTSVTGWFVMALQSARMAGLKVPKETLEGATRYLDSAQMGGGRRYGYWHDANETPAMNAEGLLCRQYLGWKQDDPRLVEGVGALTKNPVSYDRGGETDVYYWYYATQATHHMEGAIWDAWNKVMRQEVPAHQVKTGPEAGSWDPQSDKWGASSGGRLYVTCLSIYNLEVYYRHLPIYSGYRSLENTVPGTDPAAKPDAEAAVKPGADSDEKPAPSEADKPAGDKTLKSE